MDTIRTILNGTVSISAFNKGLAGKIFHEVKKTGAKVVMKNNVPECVLLSPEEYLKLLDEVNDARLLMLANQRMNHFDPNSLSSIEEINEKYGITSKDLKDAEEVEFE